MRYSPNPVKPSSTKRRRGRARSLRAALGLLAFAVVAILGNVLLRTQGAAASRPASPTVVAADWHSRATRLVATSRCGKVRSPTHPKHARPHGVSATVDDDDDDDDDGAIVTVAAAFDEPCILPAPSRPVLDAIACGRATSPRAPATQTGARRRAPHEARGPPMA
jgi:hypothetical protein